MYTRLTNVCALNTWITKDLADEHNREVLKGYGSLLGLTAIKVTSKSLMRNKSDHKSEAFYKV